MGNRVIYTPAYDAEVEYLESDGNSYIDTGLKASSELGILAHIQVLTNSRWLFGGANGFGDKALSFLFTTGDSSYRYSSSGINLGRLSLNTTYEFDSTQNHNVMKVGSLTFTATASTFTSDYNLYLFTENRNGSLSGKSSGIRIYDFKIYNNSTLVRDFIPVRIGSVGYMYDKVTKQLFANKGTGNFILGSDVSNAVIPQQRCVLYFGNQRSVVFERIYEEYEWLVGDGNAYINTNIIYLDGVIDLVAMVEGQFGNVLGRERLNTSSDYYSRFVITINPSNGLAAVFSSNQVSAYITQPLVLQLYIKNDSLTINGQLKSLDFIPNVEANSIYLFALNRFNNPTISSQSIVKISKFSISSKINLIPCKLLQSIPAILDGNGIAREAGECGMWDKVGNKFYGNVANSGTFTVKSPKCYEEYQWLIGDGNAYFNANISYNVIQYSLGAINTYAVLNTCSFKGGGEFQFVMNYRPSTSTPKNVGIYDNQRSNWYNTPIQDVNTIQIDSISNTNNIVVNNVDLSNPNKIPSKTLSMNKIVNANGLKVSAITINATNKLVPCKLTHGIPASMDANGISRPAGTCGMWDKVNDKFYGNVGSGSFTVSN